MIADTIDPPAVFDAEAVSGLTGHPGDHAFAVVFVTRYRRLLPERVRRIAQTLAVGEAGDTAVAMDAVLSLKVASTTVGAHELARIAGRLERLVRRGDLAQAVVLQTALVAAVARVDHALGAFLGD
jgi:hypothetical protein